MEYEILTDGRLRIYCDPEEQRTIEPTASDAFLYEGECLEKLLENSELEWMPEGVTGDLTSAPMLGITAERLLAEPLPPSFGEVLTNSTHSSSVIARWAFMSYQVRSYVDDLAQTGECFWEGGYAGGRLPS